MQAMDLWGIDLEAHQASPLGHALLNDTALILTMAREHLLVVGRLDPPALQRSTTLKCLAEAGEWLMSRIDEGAVASEKQASQRIKSVLAFLGERYSGQEFLADMQSRSSDIIDPIGSSLRVYIDVLEDIERCLAAVMPVLFGRPAEPQ
jgi:protein-tyrosine-phosphatase